VCDSKPLSKPERAQFIFQVDLGLRRKFDTWCCPIEGANAASESAVYDSKPSGAWIKIKLYQQGSFVIGVYIQTAGKRKHMGALLVGVNELNKIAVQSCPFFNLPVKPVAGWIQG
jgi:hypothetical protein